MKEIYTFKDLCSFVDTTMACKKQDKPTLIWFDGTPERSNMIMDHFNQMFISHNYDIKKENLGGVIKNTNKLAIVFHRYVDQMEDSFLMDIVESGRQTNKPVFLFANSYEQKNKPQWVDDCFDVVVYNPVMRVVLVSCSSKKKIINESTSIQAKDLYDSPLFKKAWLYSSRMSVDKRFILSDKYGLLDPEGLIKTYNCSLKKMTKDQRQQWAMNVVKNLTSKGFDLNRDEFLLLTGRLYLQVLKDTGSFNNIHSLYQDNGLTGIGFILKFLK